MAGKVHESCKTNKACAAPQEHNYNQNAPDGDDSNTVPSLAEEIEITTEGDRKERHTTRTVTSTSP